MSHHALEDQVDRALERRLRGLALRQGLHLWRSSTQVEEAPDYGLYIIADENNWLLCSEHGMALEDVEAWLNDGEPSAVRDDLNDEGLMELIELDEARQARADEEQAELDAEREADDARDRGSGMYS